MSSNLYKLVKNIGVNQIGFLVSVCVAFLLSPFVVHSLGDKYYGIWSLIVSFAGHYGLLTFGIQGALTRYVSYSIAKGDNNAASAYLSCAFFFLIITAMLCMVVGLLLSKYSTTLFHFADQAVFETRVSILIVSLTVAVTFVFACFQCNLVANQRFDLINTVGIASTLIRAGLTVYLLKSGHGIVSLALLGFCVTTAVGCINFILSKVFCPNIVISVQFFKIKYFKELLNFGSKSFVISIAVTLVYQCDLLVIGIYLPPDKITLYSLASTLISYYIQFVASITNVFAPFVTEKFVIGGTTEMKKFCIEAGQIMYMLAGIAVSGCIVFGKSFFNLWVGQGYSNSAVVLSLLILPQFFATGNRVSTSILGAMNKMTIMASLSIFEGILNLALSILLVRNYGIFGVALGTLIPLILTNGILFPLYVVNVLKINIFNIFINAMLPGVLIALTTYFSGSFLISIISPLHWAAFIFDVFAVIVINVTSCLIILMFTKNSKINFKSVALIINRSGIL